MRLTQLLAADALGGALDDARRARAGSVLTTFGFQRTMSGYVLDGTYPWVTVAEMDGILHVHVLTPLPSHLASPALAAFEGLATEAGLVRLDPLTRREITALEWKRRAQRELGPRQGMGTS
jgi:hypothetical protein